MKTTLSILISAMALTLAGCTTSSQVQEMIDASHRDYTEQSESQQASIDVLKKSAVTGLEKAKENAELIATLQQELMELEDQAKVIQGYADAAKVMSAANTVKVSDLEEAVEANQEWADKTTEQLAQIDKTV